MSDPIGKSSTTAPDPGPVRDQPAAHPTELAQVDVRPYHHPAAGFGAIASTVKHTMHEMGMFRGASTLLKVNQAHGFDCPGCAWPEPGVDHRSHAEFCENGAKAVAAEATTRRVTPDFFNEWSIPLLLEQSDHWLESQGRLTHPMVLTEGASRYTPITWEDAFNLIAGELRKLDSPDEAIFYTSGRTSNEAAFLYQLFVRLFGTNNLPDCSNMCHESSGVGLGDTIGVGKGTVSLADFNLADAIFVIGQNPGTNHPRMLSALEAAARRGCHIVSVNPLHERALDRFAHPQHVGDMLKGGTAIAELFLPVRINGDVALLKGIMKEVLEEERRRPGQVLDRSFIAEHTSGFDAFAAALDAASWEEILEQSGVDLDLIRRAAQIYIAADRVIVCWAMGLTQHKNGVANIQEVVNLLLLRGNLGRPGAGACPVRGHSNVQGDRTMGIYERPSADFLDRLGRTFGFEPPRAHGFDVVAAIKAMHDRRAHVFFAMGGNFHSASPDTAYTAEALRRCRLTVQVSTKLNRGHLVTGRQALILPCLGRTELDTQAGGLQFVTVEDSMSAVHSSRGGLAPASEFLLSEPAIVARLGRAVFGADSRVDWEALAADYDRIRDGIAQVIPGFEDFNNRVRQPNGFVLPNAAAARRFVTATGKAQFSVLPIPRIELAPGQLLMMTVRSHDQYNTTVYGLDDRYRGVYQERRVVFMNQQDIVALGLVDRQVVDLIGEFRGERRLAPRFIVIPYDIPRGCTATYFPEANVLVPVDDFADGSRTPASKSVVIRVVPTDSPDQSRPMSHLSN
ncbi:oxidoreductase alpha (molybdopterin) subunit [Singulisphaera sp. GP187]|uniref:FdhF/YdeP family oxidoreductase n=1 Tax=Singulisphaera sp. GP187 TaxID=1882752 RepID=UPI0009286900|nr:FdhF/YdeP family oxidoreductase [Singulisphaera sp. GP187]SIN70999.1 oxidoreductase alpha (molybdopterin) subunit [Singulisphaera sp. GP187]